MMEENFKQFLVDNTEQSLSKIEEKTDVVNV